MEKNIMKDILEIYSVGLAARSIRRRGKMSVKES